MTDTCDCLDKLDAALEKHNTKAARMWQHANGSLVETVRIDTVVREKKRGARPMNAIPNYCPFCGQRYQKLEDSRG